MTSIRSSPRSKKTINNLSVYHKETDILPVTFDYDANNLPTAAGIFGGTKANELKSKGARGDGKAETLADSMAKDAEAMAILHNSDMAMAEFIHPTSSSLDSSEEVKYKVDGVTNNNILGYQNTKRYSNIPSNPNHTYFQPSTNSAAPKIFSVMLYGRLS